MIGNVNKQPRELEYVGIDYWSRPLFKDQNESYFGSLNKLFPDGATFEDITSDRFGPAVTEEDICYFGKEIDGDPMGDNINPKRIKLVKEFNQELTIEEQF